MQSRRTKRSGRNRFVGVTRRIKGKKSRHSLADALFAMTHAMELPHEARQPRVHRDEHALLKFAPDHVV